MATKVQKVLGDVKILEKLRETSSNLINLTLKELGIDQFEHRLHWSHRAEFRSTSLRRLKQTFYILEALFGL